MIMSKVKVKQRSDEWFEQRRGRFTASEIGSLMAVRGLGAGANTYCLQKAIEHCYDIEEDNYVSDDMKRGVEQEPLAFSKFKEIMQQKFIDVTEAEFEAFGEHAGASPDGLVGDYGVLEIKCPRPFAFFKIVADGEIDNAHNLQMQMQMLCTGRSVAYYFNYIIINAVEYWHTIEVQRDDELCELLEKRINEAIIIKVDYINKIKTNLIGY
jgi:putative phage-type endonuclease